MVMNKILSLVYMLFFRCSRFKTVLLLLCFFVMSTFVHAQKKVRIWGYVVDRITYQAVNDVKFTVMTVDSVALFSDLSGEGDKGGKPMSFVIFSITQAGKYIIKCEKEGYETTYNDYEVKKLYPDILIKGKVAN